MASLTHGKHPNYLLVQHPAADIALPSRFLVRYWVFGIAMEMEATVTGVRQTT